MTEEKRGSSGGNARKENLSPERRKEIAKLAAHKRWEKKSGPMDMVKEIPSDAPEVNGLNEGIPESIMSLAPTTYPTYGGIERGSIPIVEPNFTPHFDSPTKDEAVSKHCPACLEGKSLEEGEGTHILATVEHPVTLPAAFADAESVIAVPEPPAPPQKPAKRQAKNMPKEFKTASSYAEKRLPVAIKEKSDHVGAVARLDAEINDLVRVIKALGGNVDPQAVQPQVYQPYQPVSYAPQVPNLPAPYPEYQPPILGQLPMSATPPTTVTVPRPMKMGGAGALDFSGIIND